MLYRFVHKQFQVLFHWAFRPSFRLSLTVLVHYRSRSIFSLGGWFPQIPTKFVHRGTQDTPKVLFDFVYEIFTLYDWPFQIIPLSKRNPTSESYNPLPCKARESLGFCHFALRYWGNLCWFLFLTLLRCFSSGGFLHCNYISTEVENFVTGWLSMNSTGFPHSDTAGSKDFDSSPTTFAVLCVLLRYFMPRHPLFALISDFHPMHSRRTINF